MQTRAKTTSEKSLSMEEIDMISQQLNKKEQQLRDQAESLRIQQERMEQERLNFAGIRDDSPEIRTLGDMVKILAEQIKDLRIKVSEQPRIIQQQNSFEPQRKGTTEFNSNTQPLNEAPMSPANTRNILHLKDIVDSIPKYNGQHMSIFQFCKICERTLTLIHPSHEFTLIQLIINKL